MIKGKVELQWDNHSEVLERHSCFDEGPIVLHLPESVSVVMTGLEKGSELGIEKCRNERSFESKLYRASDCREDVFGKGAMEATRTVRTVFDGETAPWSNMVMGEVITHPGKWSSYPPHPEIYHYRFLPEQGFGAAFLDYDSFTVRDRDTCQILPDKTHSQVAAAGYAMWYVWMISYLRDDRWKPSTRYFRKEHEWLLKEEYLVFRRLVRCKSLIL